MALGKQAKTLTPKQIEVALSYLTTTRHGVRNQVIFLLSCKAGLRAKEIAALTWSMVVDASGHLGTTINLTNDASKGSKGGRVIPMNKELRAALHLQFPTGVTTSAVDRVSTSAAGLLISIVAAAYGAGRSKQIRRVFPSSSNLKIEPPVRCSGA